MLIENGWLVGAARCESPNFNARPADTCVDCLVVHNISLPPRQFGGQYIHQFFQNSLDCSVHPYFAQLEGVTVSAHCLIERTGQVTQFVSFDDRAWHAGVSQLDGRENCNDFSIGIELEGTDDLPYTESQYKTLTALAAALLQYYPAMTVERIVGHSDIAPDRKTDPGEAFDWQKLRQGLK